MASVMVIEQGDDCVQLLCDHKDVVSTKGGDEYTPARVYEPMKRKLSINRV